MHTDPDELALELRSTAVRYINTHEPLDRSPVLGLLLQASTRINRLAWERDELQAQILKVDHTPHRSDEVGLDE